MTFSTHQSVAKSSKQPPVATFLVVGYGDADHGDDAAGRAVIEAVEAWRLSCVKTIRVEQLTPELVAAMTEAEYVLFVSACHRQHPCHAQLTPICFQPVSQGAWPRLGEDQCTPQQLMQLTQAIYGWCPQAWSLGVPAEAFSPGACLSTTARQGIAQTLDTIATFLRCYTPIQGCDRCQQRLPMRNR